VRNTGIFLFILLKGIASAQAGTCDLQVDYQNSQGDHLRVQFDNTSECTPIAVVRANGEIDSVFDSLLTPSSTREIAFVHFADSTCAVDAYLDFNFDDQSTIQFRECSDRYAANIFTRVADQSVSISIR
jgi:hypothetical protein